MNCDDLRPQLLDYHRGRLSARLQEDVRAHLQTCSACEHEIAAEALLTEVLEHRLPQHGAPPALATAAVLLIAVPVYYQQAGRSQNVGSTSMITEAVTDHLRLLASQHPLDVESGDMHHVKPWYEGRLDFAPVVHFLGDQEFPLAGGAVGYFLDRKAAVFVFHRRLHTISLFVFPARGVPWPTRGLDSLGPVKAYRSDDRGFHVILWRKGEQGCALVSDVDPPELIRLAERLVATP